MELLNARTRILLNLFLPQRQKTDPKYAIPESDKNLSGQTIVFTGGTDGIGRVAVEMLYEMNANIVLLVRNPKKAQNVIQELELTKRQSAIDVEICDLAAMQSVKDCANRILKKYDKIDILVNCAGINSTNKAVSKEGFEMNWAINYFGPYLLTNLLLARLKESASARIVNVTTNTDFLDKINFDDIEKQSDFATNDNYPASKLSLNMFSIGLAERLKGTGVTVNYLYPGYIKSNLLRHLKGGAKMMKFLMNIMASPTEVGADRIVRLAISSEYKEVTGVYVAEDQIMPPHSEAQIASKREKLEQITAKALNRWL